MKTRTEETIGSREFVALILIVIGMKLSDNTPSVLFAVGQTGGWIIPLFAFVIILVPFLALMSVLKKRKNQGLMEVVFELAGPYGGMAIGLALFLMTLSATAISSRSYVDIINIMVYQRSPIPALYFMLMGAACYVGSRGIVSVGRIALIVIPYIELALFLLIAFVWRDVEWMHLFPLAGPGWIELMREGAFHSGMYGELILMALLVPSIRSFKDYRKGSYIGSTISAAKIGLLLAVYLTVFDYPVIYRISSPFQQLTKDASAGQIVTHMESIFLAFWLITSVIYFAIFVYLLTFLFGRTFGMKANHDRLALPLSGLIVLLGLLPENNGQVVYIWKYVLHAGSFVFAAVPLLLWGLDRLRRFRS